MLVIEQPSAGLLHHFFAQRIRQAARIQRAGHHHKAFHTGHPHAANAEQHQSNQRAVNQGFAGARIHNALGAVHQINAAVKHQHRHRYRAAQ